MQLKGRHVLITGAGKRIGRALAEDCLHQGAKLSAHYHSSEKEIEELGRKARELKASFYCFKADLRDIDALRKGVKSAQKGLGDFSLLINSASAFYPTPADACTEAQWDALLDVNLKGQFFLAQAVHQHMKSGLILNLCDVYAETGLPRFAPYAASKGGLLNLTKTLAGEWAPNVRVNAISPGAILYPENYSEEQKERSRAKTLLKREGKPEDIVAAANFLIQNEYVTGLNLVVDGGREL